MDKGSFSLIAFKPENMSKAADYSAGKNGVSVLIIQGGKTIFEDYRNGGSETAYWPIASGTKSFSGIMAVAAAEDGILSLDEKAGLTLTEWRDNPQKSKITVRQLLNFTSGVKTGRGDGLNVPTYAEAVAADMLDEPGEVWRYGSVHLQCFGEIMKRKTGRSPLDYMNERIFNPIGMKYQQWNLGRDGNPQLPVGAVMSAREWAKYGELIASGGKWQGKQILNPTLLQECFKGTKANPAYGLTFRLQETIPDELVENNESIKIGMEPLWKLDFLPADLCYAAGSGGQRLFVSRSQGLVIVRQARGIMEAIRAGATKDFSSVEFMNLLLTGRSAN